MDDSSTIEETEVNPEFEEVLEVLNEMHEEAQRLAILNNWCNLLTLIEYSLFMVINKFFIDI